MEAEGNSLYYRPDIYDIYQSKEMSEALKKHYAVVLGNKVGGRK